MQFTSVSAFLSSFSIPKLSESTKADWILLSCANGLDTASRQKASMILRVTSPASFLSWTTVLLVCPKIVVSPFVQFSNDLWKILCMAHVLHYAQKLLLLSRFSRVRLCATPWTAAYQASLSMGFSRQEHWSGLPFPSPNAQKQMYNYLTFIC